MTHSPEKDAPIRPCCMTRHYGPVCPDGLVMCQLCFERVPIERLNLTSDGSREDVCQPCADREAARVIPTCPDCAPTSRCDAHWCCAACDAKQVRPIPSARGDD